MRADIDRAVEAAERRDFDASYWQTQQDGFCDESEPEDDLCPGCAESVTHPLYRDRYADDVRRIGQPYTGWHNACAEDEEQAKAALVKERDAILAFLPSMRQARFLARLSEVANG